MHHIWMCQYYIHFVDATPAHVPFDGPGILSCWTFTFDSAFWQMRIHIQVYDAKHTSHDRIMQVVESFHAQSLMGNIYG